MFLWLRCMSAASERENIENSFDEKKVLKAMSSGAKRDKEANIP